MVLLFFCSAFSFGLENLNRVNISFEKASSAMGAECCMHEYAFSFINEELKCS